MAIEANEDNTRRRSQRTRALIQAAFIKLVEQRGFDEISVLDISRLVKINPSTFYRHFKSKYDLAEEVFKDAVEAMGAEAGLPRVIHGKRDLAQRIAGKRFQTAWAGLFEHFRANSRLYAAMLGGNGSAWFQARMRRDIKDFMARTFPQAKHETKAEVVPVDFAREFFATAFVGILQLLLESDRKYPASEIANWLGYILRKGIVGVLAGLR